MLRQTYTFFLNAFSAAPQRQQCPAATALRTDPAHIEVSAVTRIDRRPVRATDEAVRQPAVIDFLSIGAVCEELAPSPPGDASHTPRWSAASRSPIGRCCEADIGARAPPAQESTNGHRPPPTMSDSAEGHRNAAVTSSVAADSQRGPQISFLVAATWWAEEKKCEPATCGDQRAL